MEATPKLVKVRIESPERLGFHGCWSARRNWPAGVTEQELPEALVHELMGEIKRGESLLKVTIVEEKVAEPEAKKPASSVAHPAGRKR